MSFVTGFVVANKAFELLDLIGWQHAREVLPAIVAQLARSRGGEESNAWRHPVDLVPALHTFSYCNALHQVVRRCPSPLLVRGVFHGAIAVYLDRFLNVPPATLPDAAAAPATEPREPEKLLAQFLELLDQRHEVEAAARAVVRYVRLGHPIVPLLETLVQAAVREDADFHTLQMVEAGIRQFEEWPGQPEAEHILVAVARFLAAHSPTQRAQLQTATVALRLHRGETLYESAESPGG